MLSRSLINQLTKPSFGPLARPDLFNQLAFRTFLEGLNQPLIATPATDFKETDSQFILKADLPGFEKNQIDIDIKGDTLTIRGALEESKVETEADWDIKERYSSSFQRSYRLPQEIQKDSVKASLEHGVLTLKIPKVEESSSKVLIE
jgi:HSP20 family protein